MVTLSRTRPRVGVPVAASLTDPDGSISGLRWQWYRDIEADALPTQECSADQLPTTVTSRMRRRTSYTPTKADADANSRAGATLQCEWRTTPTVMLGCRLRWDEQALTILLDEDTRNKPPAFVDQDTETKGMTRTKRPPERLRRTPRRWLATDQRRCLACRRPQTTTWAQW